MKKTASRDENGRFHNDCIEDTELAEVAWHGNGVILRDGGSR